MRLTRDPGEEPAFVLQSVLAAYSSRPSGQEIPRTHDLGQRHFFERPARARVVIPPYALGLPESRRRNGCAASGPPRSNFVRGAFRLTQLNETRFDIRWQGPLHALGTAQQPRPIRNRPSKLRSLFT